MVRSRKNEKKLIRSYLMIELNQVLIDSTSICTWNGHRWSKIWWWKLKRRRVSQWKINKSFFVVRCSLMNFLIVILFVFSLGQRLHQTPDKPLGSFGLFNGNRLILIGEKVRWNHSETNWKHFVFYSALRQWRRTFSTMFSVWERREIDRRRHRTCLSRFWSHSTSRRKNFFEICQSIFTQF